MQFKNKTTIVEAFQLDENGLIKEKWFWDAVTEHKIIAHDFGKWEIGGGKEVHAGDYIIRHRNGNIASLPEEAFTKIYEPEVPEISGKASHPIEVYTSQEQLDASLKEWQHRLYLDGWMIRAEIVDEISDMGTGEDVDDAVGLNTQYPVVSQAYIQILSNKSYETKNPLLERICMEKTLVHELLHCLYCWMDAPDSFEGVYYETKEHQQLEQMAKSLVMAKYQLDYDYFWRKT